MHVKYVEAQAVGVVWKLEVRVLAQVSSSSLDWGSKLRDPKPVALELLQSATVSNGTTVDQWSRSRTRDWSFMSSSVVPLETRCVKKAAMLRRPPVNLVWNLEERLPS
ncbi:hypothetical protein TNCV_2643351 [Trichonephila clavipes]|nr:hypothetical protein TNCV_2643351 [Trichonephila clavipes]